MRPADHLTGNVTTNCKMTTKVPQQTE